MISKKLIFQIVIVCILVSVSPLKVFADDECDLSISADIVSRYLWRGLLVNDAPNIQPSVSLEMGSFEIGLWGSTSLSKTVLDSNFSFNNEIDLWLGYAFEMSNGMELGFVVTDYYFPDTGVKIGNFNDYDDADGAGAHTIEAGVTISGSESFPVSFSGFVNLYNDEGQNTYFQVDYSTEISGIGLDLFVGAAGGSDKNPGYYGTEKLNVINLGFTTSKVIEITDKFELPVFTSVILNPNSEYLSMVLGISL